MSYQNTTLTSPTVYISFETAFAQDECSSAVGKNHTGAILALQPDQVSSIHGSLGPQFITGSSVHFHGSWVPAPFNYTNLALTPVPLSVYLDQPSCYDAFCSTIYTDYRPVLSVPQQVRSLDPAWGPCDLFWGGINDPPKALQPTDSAAGVTTPAGGDITTSTGAAPSSKITSPTVTPTALYDSSPTPSASVVEGPSSSNIETIAKPSSTSSASLVAEPSGDQISSFTREAAAEPGSSLSASLTEEPSVTQQSSAAPESLTPISPSSDANQAEGPSEIQQTSSTSETLTLISPTSDAADNAPPATSILPEATSDTITVPDNSYDPTSYLTTQLSPTNAVDVLTQAEQSQNHESGAVSVISTGGSQDGVIDPSTTLVTFHSSTYTVVQAGPTTSTSVESGHFSGSTEAAFATSQAVFVAGSSTYTTYQAQGTEPAVIVGSGTTLTLAAGASTRLAGAGFSVDPSGYIAIGGTSLEYVTGTTLSSAAPSQGAVFQTASGSAILVDGTTLSSIDELPNLEPGAFRVDEQSKYDYTECGCYIERHGSDQFWFWLCAVVVRGSIVAILQPNVTFDDIDACTL
ncbi:hypothetical protein LTR08_005012 [Meristemomyces frigidus]|nr:hypothetical protein LTR08_005012 [Meristemomyces frigidus]